jgi:hypothetical protein
MKQAVLPPFGIFVMSSYAKLLVLSVVAGMKKEVLIEWLETDRDVDPGSDGVLENFVVNGVTGRSLLVL